MQINEVKKRIRHHYSKSILFQHQENVHYIIMYIIIIFLHVCYFTLKNKRFCHSKKY
jgi:hypothetical protein